MDGALGQQLKVVKKNHPPGERGVRTSLEAVAQKIAEGGSHPKVVAWARECLVRANRLEGISCKTDRERADVLLRAVQKKLWIPDPVATEFMAGAHLLACDASTRDEICFLGADCDELATLLGASYLAVGLNTMIVGHGYDRERNIQHVLCAVRVRKQGGAGAISGGRHQYEWLYADPSMPQLKLGQVTPFTRERLLSVPNVQVICDANSCLVDRDFDPDELGFVERGVYVGVDGPPELRPRFVWLAAPPTFQWLGQEKKSAVEQVIDNCQSAVTDADLSTAASRANSFKTGGKCAADALCTFYSEGAIPPGICSSVAGPVLGAVVDVWNSVFGGDPSIDCSRESSFDPCSVCKQLAWQMTCRGNPFQFSIPNFQQPVPAQCASNPNVPPGCVDWRAGAGERARAAAIAEANSTILEQYNNLWNDMMRQLRAKFGLQYGPGAPPGPADKVAQVNSIVSSNPALQYVDFANGTDMSKPETGLEIARATTAIAPSYQAATGEPLKSQYIPAGAAAAPSRKGGGALPVVLGLGAAGALAYFLFLR